MTTLAAESTYIATALKSWDQWIGRATRTFDSLSDQAMLTPIAPGKNRPIYLLGHLIAVNDSMVSQLGLGEPAHEALRQPFLAQPDADGIDISTLPELRQNWKDLNARLTTLFAQLTPEQWLERHALVSEEDFAKDPSRNRLAILLSRTAHTSYHLGQLILVAKPR